MTYSRINPPISLIITKLEKNMINKHDQEQMTAELNRLGYNSYSEFLQQDLWKNLKKQMYHWNLTHKELHCYCCKDDLKSKMFHWHHLSYENILNSKKIKMLCPKCHNWVHHHKLAKIKSVEELTHELADYGGVVPKYKKRTIRNKKKRRARAPRKPRSPKKKKDFISDLFKNI